MGRVSDYRHLIFFKIQEPENKDKPKFNTLEEALKKAKERTKKCHQK